VKRSRAEAAGRTTPCLAMPARPRPRPQLRRCALVPTLDSTPTASLLPPHGSHVIEYGKNYPQRNLSRDFPQIRNKRVTNLRFGWRRSPGRCTARAGLFGLQIGAPSTSPQHFSPLPLQSPNRAIGAVPIRSLPRQAKPRRRFPEPLRCRRSRFHSRSATRGRPHRR
jgi:hypothetical protein